MTHYAHTRPKARVKHYCNLCNRVIRPGEVYVKGVGMDGATAWTWRECAHCDTIRDLRRNEWDIDEYDWQTIADWEPKTVHQLRLKALWRRGWERADGSLYPVPEKVMHEDKHGFGWQVDARMPEVA